MKLFKKSVLAALVAVGVMGMAGAASADGVVGGGATLPEDLYNGPNNTDGILTGPVADFEFYTGVGSGAGKRAFFNNDPAEINHPAGVTVDYAGSDSLVSTSEFGAYSNPNNPNGRSSFGPLIQVPSVLTSVTVPYNVSGFNGSLNLSSEQLALVIADPTVVNWNDTRLAIPGAPNAPIRVIYRTEGSGTTEIFLRHLNAVNSSLVSEVSNNFASVIDVSGSKYVGAAGSDGVVDELAENDNSITYVSPDKVAFSDPTEVVAITRVIDGVTEHLLPTEVNVQAAVATMDLPTDSGQEGNPLAWGISNGLPDEGYPIVASTNLIFSQCYLDAGDSNKIRDFFNAQYTGQFDTEASQHGFIPLPAEWQDAVHETFYAANSNLSIGNTNVCNGIGRPQ